MNASFFYYYYYFDSNASKAKHCNLKVGGSMSEKQYLDFSARQRKMSQTDWTAASEQNIHEIGDFRPQSLTWFTTSILAAHSLIRGSEGRREGGVSPGTAQGRKTPGRKSRLRHGSRRGGRVRRPDVREVIGRGVKASRAVCPIAALLYSKEAESCPEGYNAERSCSRFSRQEWNKKVRELLLVINRQQDCNL